MYVSGIYEYVNVSGLCVRVCMYVCECVRACVRASAYKCAFQHFRPRWVLIIAFVYGLCPEKKNNPQLLTSRLKPVLR